MTIARRGAARVFARSWAVVAGGALVAGVGACGAAVGPGPGQAPAATTVVASSGSHVGLVSVKLEEGGTIAYPASWHSHLLPLGITPGQHAVIAVTSSAANPCTWRTLGDSTEGSCDQTGLAPGGVQVVWATSLPGPPATSRLDATRAWGPADSTCAALGGVRSLQASMPAMLDSLHQ
jgi:hypothetical protein